MIAIDSSALIAMLQDEPERAKFASIIAHASQRGGMLSSITPP
jgi:uncharacterized protein with PIN domain